VSEWGRTFLALGGLQVDAERARAESDLISVGGQRLRHQALATRTHACVCVCVCVCVCE
jgi:hypothetical protein